MSLFGLWADEIDKDWLAQARPSQRLPEGQWRYLAHSRRSRVREDLHAFRNRQDLGQPGL